jgi:hypothetical protein
VILIFFGTLSLVLWVRFCLPGKSRHVDVKALPGFWMVAWLVASIIAVLTGYIMIAV